MAITLTERAAEEVRRTQTDQAPGTETFLRIGVAAGGCSGFSYDLFFDEKFNEEVDTKSEQHGITVVVDSKSALYLDGTTWITWKILIDEDSSSITRMHRSRVVAAAHFRSDDR